jgi:hypothetical protein
MCFLASSLSAGLRIGLPGATPRSCMISINLNCADLYLQIIPQTTTHESLMCTLQPKNIWWWVYMAYALRKMLNGTLSLLLRQSEET